MTSFWGLLRAGVRVALATALAGTLLAAGLVTWVYHQFASDLPANLDVVTDYRPLRASQVVSADGEIIGEFFVEKRVLVPMGEIPAVVRHAFVAAEDTRFYDHGGIDYLGIVRAAWANLRAGQVVQGGSTITQQVAKLLIVGKERSLARKVREAMLAFRIERTLSKDQILGVYLNHVYLGHGAYGVAAAASAYFGKTVRELSAAEAAMLAGLPKAPGQSTPFHDFDRARARQHYVIGQMEDLKFLDHAQAESARKEPLVLVSRGRALKNVAAPYFVETVRKYVADKYGDEELLERGLRIFTTLDMGRQRAAEAALRAGLEDLERRLGFSGPIAHVEAADRAKLLRGRPRPFGPTGFTVDDAEGSGPLVAVAEPPAVTVDASKPGARVPEPIARYYAGEAWAAARKARGSTAKAPPPPPTDPDTVYAAVVTAIGARGVLVASGALATQLDAPDEQKALAWTGTAGRKLSVGDVLPVYFRPQPARPGAPANAPTKIVAQLSTRPSVEGALVAIDPSNGHLVSMVGGYDYERSQFNRARQARRQIGSAIKPLIYAAAVDRGMGPLTIKWDVPVKFKTSSGVWAPGNYKPEYLGAITLRTALAKSINTVAAQLVAELGVDHVIDVMRRAGISSKLPHALSISLGTPDLGVEEMAYALAAFPAQGQLVTPLSILKVIDADGQVLEDHSSPPPRKEVLSPETAYIVTDLMKGVVEVGTAKRARELGRPVAGKTGTSTNYRDAWFFGFTPELLCGVWVGRDDFKPIGHDATGGQVALPIWLAYMKEALRGIPVRDFHPPPGVVFVRADPEKGLPALPSAPNSRLTPFRRGTLPPAFRSASHTGLFSDQSF